METTAAEDRIKKENEDRNADSLRNFWDNVKCTSICKLDISERKKDLRTY